LVGLQVCAGSAEALKRESHLAGFKRHNNKTNQDSIESDGW